jgi:hypothetical protein
MVSTQRDGAATIPPQYAGLVDDAAVFPPGNAPLAAAVRDHLAHREAAYAGLLGPFVISDGRLPELIEVLSDLDRSLPVTVVVSGGAGGLEPAARWAEGSALLDLRGLEVALRDLDDLVGAARRTAAAADLGLDVPTYVELPVVGASAGSHQWLAALDEVAAADLRLKWRTGGTTADLFPSSADLAAAIDASLDRELPFKATAGLHAALRHRDPETGFEHHGFLDVLVAARAALDGDDVVAALEERDADALRVRLDALGEETLTRTRRWFTSLGCCGVQDPLGDLVRLGLVAL